MKALQLVAALILLLGSTLGQKASAQNCTASMSYVVTLDSTTNTVNFIVTNTSTGSFTDWYIGVTDACGGYAADTLPASVTTTTLSLLSFQACQYVTFTYQVWDTTHILGCNPFGWDTLTYNAGAGTGPQCNSPFSYTPVTNTFNTYTFMPGAASPGSTYLWDFGDGTTSTQQSPSHAFTQSNTLYTVYLTVLDPNGTSCVYFNYIYTYPVPSPCDASFYGNNYDTVGATFSFYPTLYGQNVVGKTVFWDFGDGTTSTDTGAQVNHIYTQTGYYNAFHTITDSTCTDSFVAVVYVVTPPTQCPLNLSVSNSTDTLFMAVTNMTAAPGRTFTFSIYYYDKYNGANGMSVYTTTPDPNFSYGLGNGATVVVAAVYMSDSVTSCYSSAIDSVSSRYLGQAGTGALLGYVVSDDSLFWHSPIVGDVYVIQYDSLAGTLTAIDTAFCGNGTFNAFGFYGANYPSGQYLLKFVPDTIQTPGHLPAYYKVDANGFPSYSMTWSNADYVQVSSSILLQTSWSAPTGVVPPGPGFVGGNVSQGANKTMGVGDPMPGMSIMLLDAMKKPLGNTFTHTDGNFSYPSLAYGSYYLHAEHPGMATTDMPFTIDAANPGVTINMEAGSAGIFAAGIEQITLNGVEVSLYPNPTSDVATLNARFTKPTPATVEVVDGAGRVVSSQRLTLGGQTSTNATVNVANLPAGLYRLSIKTEGNPAISLPLSVLR